MTKAARCASPTADPPQPEEQPGQRPPRVRPVCLGCHCERCDSSMSSCSCCCLQARLQEDSHSGRAVQCFHHCCDILRAQLSDDAVHSPCSQQQQPATCQSPAWRLATWHSRQAVSLRQALSAASLTFLLKWAVVVPDVELGRPKLLSSARVTR